MKNIILCILFTALIGLCNQDYEYVIFDDFDNEENFKVDTNISNTEYAESDETIILPPKHEDGHQPDYDGLNANDLIKRGQQSFNRNYAEEAEISGYGSSVWDKKFSFYPGIDLEANRAVYRKDFIKNLCLVSVAILIILALFIFIKNKRKQLKSVVSKGAEKISTGAIGLINLLWYALPLLILILIILLIILIVK